MTAKELRALHAVATPAPWSQILELCDEEDCPCGELFIPEICRSFHSCDWADAEDFQRDRHNVDLIVYLRNHCEEIIADRERLDWLIAQCNDPARTVEQIGADLCAVIAGGCVAGVIAATARDAIDLARGAAK